MLTTIYILSTVLGGGLIALSTLFGDHGDGDAGADGGADAGGDAGGDAGDGGGEGGHAGTWLPILSLQFWTFGLAFFGLTGLLLSTLTSAPVAVQLLTALPTGAISGLGVSYGIRKMRTQQISSSLDEQAYLGTEATLLFPLQRGDTSKIRFSLQGRTLELLAVTEEDAALPAGARVVITEIERGRAKVIAADLFLPAPDELA